METMMETQVEHSTSDREEYLRRAHAVCEQVGRVILGKNRSVQLLMLAMLAGGHVLIEDVPGVGKTSLAVALSRATSLSYNRIQFTPDVMPSDVVGFTMYQQDTHSFVYKPGMVMCNVLLADEINRTSSKTQSSLLEAMEEYRVSIDGTAHELPRPFFVMATQNPLGFIGTMPLPEAQLDRFILKLRLGYPSIADEVRIIADRRTSEPVDAVEPVASGGDILAMQRIVQSVHISEELLTYIVQLVAETREDDKIELGASPRASLALMKLSQAHAFLSGRDFVTVDDIIEVFLPAMRHRIHLKPKCRVEQLTKDDVLTQAFQRVKPPIR